MNYRTMVEKLIEAKYIPEKKMRKGVYGYAKYEYYDSKFKVVVVAYYDDDGELVTQTEYDVQEIVDMCEGLD